MKKEFIAHCRGSDGTIQTVKDHLIGTSDLAGKYAQTINMKSFGEILGLLHDLGKGTDIFNRYIQSGSGLISKSDEKYVEAEKLKGMIDHASAGAQYIYNQENLDVIIKSIVALLIKSHHGGLIDCLTPDGDNLFEIKMQKSLSETRLVEALSNCDTYIIERVNQLLSKDIIEEWQRKIEQLKNLNGVEQRSFARGLLCRHLFSCLIDADRQDTADFENHIGKGIRQNGSYVSWEVLISRLEAYLLTFRIRNHVDELRNKISIECKEFAQRTNGIYELTVPTGGGKTLASLRFALHHANLHHMDRIIYVVPYTTIIDQNAQSVRQILEYDHEYGTIVLEHHSNLTPEEDTEQVKLLSENWDAPIVYTTMVQLLDSLFSGGTRAVRRMHQLANSIIIFDEIQNLNVQFVHLFNLAMLYLNQCCHSTIILCTATQPLLNNIYPKEFSLPIGTEDRMILSPNELYKELSRTRIEDITKPGGWTNEEIADKVCYEFTHDKSVLIVVNTKKSAIQLVEQLADVEGKVFHLSTGMCPEHRSEILTEMILSLKNARNKSGKPIICISTQLIEAGVDIDFDTVIRFTAGLDSIVQAAGRCNRNGLMKEKGIVYIINPKEENLSHLEDIKLGKQQTERILNEFKNNPKGFDDDLLSPRAMQVYYQYYFFARQKEMPYPLDLKEYGIQTSMLDLLSQNQKAMQAAFNKNSKMKIRLQYSFMTAGKHFKALDSQTQGVIVFYKEGREIINQLLGNQSLQESMVLLKRAQRFAVNLFCYQIRELEQSGAICTFEHFPGVYYLREEYYNDIIGVLKTPRSLEPIIL